MKRTRGSAMVEFALVMPILFMLSFGLMEFGLLIYNKAIIADASRLGARYGTILTGSSYVTTSQVVTYTTNYCTNKLVTLQGTPSVTVTATSSATPPSFGATLTVVVNFTYTDLVIHNFIGGASTHPITATTVMNYE